MIIICGIQLKTDLDLFDIVLKYNGIVQQDTPWYSLMLINGLNDSVHDYCQIKILPLCYMMFAFLYSFVYYKTAHNMLCVGTKITFIPVQ